MVVSYRPDNPFVSRTDRVVGAVTRGLTKLARSLARGLHWVADKISRERGRAGSDPMGQRGQSGDCGVHGHPHRRYGPRPILLVKEEVEGEVLHESVAAMLAREGYLVLCCGSETFDTLKVVAPCPFTQADVEKLRELANALGLVAAKAEVTAVHGVEEIARVAFSDMGAEVEEAALRSIADRIAGMLAVEDAR